jgi:hypothetical protein
MRRHRRKSYWASAFNAGTAVNVLLIPIIVLIFSAGGFYFVDKYKFEIYDQATKDVTEIKMHNAAADEQVKEMRAMLDKISNQIYDLQRAAPISGPGAGGGPAVGGGAQTKH